MYESIHNSSYLRTQDKTKSLHAASRLQRNLQLIGKYCLIKNNKVGRKKINWILSTPNSIFFDNWLISFLIDFSKKLPQYLSCPVIAQLKKKRKWKSKKKERNENTENKNWKLKNRQKMISDSAFSMSSVGSITNKFIHVTNYMDKLIT